MTMVDTVADQLNQMGPEDVKNVYRIVRGHVISQTGMNPIEDISNQT